MKRKRISESSVISQPDAAGTSLSEDYDVFLNFRGADIRYNFVDCLYEFLKEAGIRVFMDDEALRVGDVIGDELLRAIDSSRFYVTIFSRTYASSKWCLMELARMVKCTRKSEGKEILPLFFDVEPDDVKLKTELYANDLLLHENKFGHETVRKWRKALRRIPKSKGWNLKSNQGYGKLITRITEDISRRLELRNKFLPDHLVGMDHQVQAVLELLDCGSINKRIVVIHGMGGIGKTTLAKAVFNKICGQFQGCSFLSNIREESERNTIVMLQKELLQDVVKFSSQNFYDASDAMIRIRRALSNKNVVIVLDDVSDRDQIMKLVGMGEWIGHGSRVIITTRNLSCIDNIEEGESSTAHKIVYPYEMGELRFNDSLRLLSWHAFRSDVPPSSHDQLSHDVISFTRGVPLAIEVVGSYLRRKSIAIWKEMLKKLKKAPPEEIFQNILMLIYKKLSNEEKEVFLDIAFFFTGHEKTNAFHYWDACDLYPEMSTYTLVSYALVKIDSSNRFWMHDLLKNLGREVVRNHKQGIKNLGKRSRLCNEDAMRMLKRGKGTRKVKALKLDSTHPHNFKPIEFAALSGLRFLELSGGNFVGNFGGRLSKLRWLSWHNCPLDFQGTMTSLKNLVVLQISGDAVTHSWGGWENLKTAKNLKVLVLEGLSLTKTPEFSSYLHLERLVINDCKSLVRIDPTVSNLRCLKSLEVKRDDSQRLPEDISSDKICSEVLRLPRTICNLRAISRLEIVGVELKRLPGDIGELKGLKILMLKNCGALQLPQSIGGLISLRELWINGSGITELPESVGGLRKLKLLDVSQNRLTRLPPTIGALQNLESLNASDNEQMVRKIPSAVSGLQSLSSLNLSRTGIRRLPTSISKLSHLQDLHLDACDRIRKLPELPSSLSSLNLSSRSLEVVPDLSNLTNLVRLSLSNCIDSEGNHLDNPDVPSGSMTWIQQLQKLEFLRLIMSRMLNFPTKLDSLSQLRELIVPCPDLSRTTLPSRLKLLGLHDPPSSAQLEHKISSEASTSESSLTEIRLDDIQSVDNISSLVVTGCQSLERVHDVSRLKNLRNLSFNGCPNLVEIRGLEQLEFLEDLEIVQCDSIQRLPHPSQIKSPRNIMLYISKCRTLRDFYGPYELYDEANKEDDILSDEA